MATALHNLSDYDFNQVPNAEPMKFGIVVSEWNADITGALLEGAVETLKRHGAKEENIIVKTVPGSFELTFGAHCFIESGLVDAVIAIGCVIRGDTPHFDYVCNEASKGIAQVMLQYKTPIGFGLLTCDSIEQAIERAGSKGGNKGVEAAAAMMETIRVLEQL